MSDLLKPKSKGYKAAFICRLFGIILLVAVILLMLPVTIPRLFGYDLYNVISGSMEPELPVGSAAYVHYTDPQTIREGDIIAFQTGDAVIMHRVVENDSRRWEFTTKGDANAMEDVRKVPYSEVLGTVASHFDGLGQFMTMLSGVAGKIILLCIAAFGAFLIIFAGRKQHRGDTREGQRK